MKRCWSKVNNLDNIPLIKMYLINFNTVCGANNNLLTDKTSLVQT